MNACAEVPDKADNHSRLGRGTHPGSISISAGPTREIVPTRKDGLEPQLGLFKSAVASSRPADSSRAARASLVRPFTMVFAHLLISSAGHAWLPAVPHAPVSGPPSAIGATPQRARIVIGRRAA